MRSTRQYWETHGGTTSPLLIIQQYFKEKMAQQEVIQRTGDPWEYHLDAADVQTLVELTKLPAATVRGIISYYKDFCSGPHTLRVCQGTSCFLAGSDRIMDQCSPLGKHSGAEKILSCYCLGHCDRSPVWMEDDGSICWGADAQDILHGRSHKMNPQPAIRFLNTEPIVLRRAHDDFSDLTKARHAGVYHSLFSALQGSPIDVLMAVELSGERGRGGAAFPTGKKWRSCAETPSALRYVIANGDEGDPGSFVDRVLMENDPHSIIEGMLLCGFAVGSLHGIIFIRSEYPRAIAKMRAAVASALQARIIGKDGLYPMEISIFPGHGSYVCGEETALLSAIEGWRGEVQIRPPYPTEYGLYGKPTVVNNVETLVNIPAIIKMGATRYRSMGTEGSAGNKAICLNHGFARPGIVEVPFGTSLASVLEDAGGSADGKPLDGIILGGPMGSLLRPAQWDIPICYTKMADQGIQLGHGGIVALPQGTNYRALLRHWLQFMKDESCGRCSPCRLGSLKAWELVQAGLSISDLRHHLEPVLMLMEQASLCAFGQLLPGPVRQILDFISESDR